MHCRVREVQSQTANKGSGCYTFPLESEVLRIVPIERIYKAPKYILVLVVTEYKQGCGVYSS